MNEQKLIEQIHHEFDSAQDRLLQEAKKVLSNPNDSVVNIAERLKAIGFVNTPTAKRGLEVKDQLVKSRQEAELIEYYAANYPFLKFLTESELDRICKKYGLKHSFASNYKNEIPESNLKDIEICQPLQRKDYPSEDIYCEIDYHSHWIPGGFLSICDKEYYALPKVIKGKHFDHWSSCDEYIRSKFNITKNIYIVNSIKNYTVNRDGIFICAPASHFINSSVFKVTFIRPMESR